MMARLMLQAHASSPLFFSKPAKLFLCPSDASSYVCWTLLRLIKHFMLTWHFLQGVAVTLFWLWNFPGWAGLQVDIRPETFWQGLLAGQFASPAKTLPVSCQDFWTWWSWSYHDHSFQTLSVSLFDKDKAISRTDEDFYLPCAASCW